MTSDQLSYKEQGQGQGQLHTSADAQTRKQNAKLAQVLVNFFTKAANIILDSRTGSDCTSYGDIHTIPYSHDNTNTNTTIPGTDNTTSEETTVRINKWFNLHMPSTSISISSKDDLKLWKSADLGALPPMIIETYLDLRQLPANQTLVLFDDEKHPWTVVKSPNGKTKKQEVVLERWLIEFDQSLQQQNQQNQNQNQNQLGADELPSMYKQAIVLFRTIYGFSRLLPAYKFKKRASTKLPLGNKILDGNQPISSKGRIGLSKPIVNNNQPDEQDPHMTQRSFKPIQTSLGLLKISIAYRKHYDFALQEQEELLSDHFSKYDEDAKKKYSVSPTTSLPSFKDNKGNNNNNNNNFNNSNKSGNDTASSLQSMNKEMSTSPKKTSSRNTTFKIGSIGNSPPPSLPPQHQQQQQQQQQHQQRQGTPTASTGTGIHTQQPQSVPIPQPIPQTTPQSISLERKVSTTSNKSISNVSLAAFLRNPRGSTSSTSNIPIVGSNHSNSNNNNNNNNNNNSSSINNNNPYGSSFPRSISSSIGHDDNFASPDSADNTPRFSSSFGSRASRRFSNTSIRQHTPQSDYFAHGNNSVDAALSGLYGDDDISEFVRMIDSTSDLKLGGASGNVISGGQNLHESESRIKSIPEDETSGGSNIRLGIGSSSGIGSGSGSGIGIGSGSGSGSGEDGIGSGNASGSRYELKKYQSLRSRHQQVSDSVNASIILQSRQSSRKSSLTSPPGSYDPGNIIISSRRDSSSRSNSYEPNKPLIVSRLNSVNSAIPSSISPASASTTAASPAPSAAPLPATLAPTSSKVVAEATMQPNKLSSIHSIATTSSINRSSSVMPTIKSGPTTVVSGLATSPSAYDYKSSTPTSLFRRGDDLFQHEDHHDCDELQSLSQGKSRKLKRDVDEDEDDLLFTMSDMHPK
ncbi:autophagy protein 13 [Lodderomyces elongisporus]|uniref:autophagy protein 13 n=1 Tax=Lodderomyces elongisporus TaxID=36914 RepID=UPI0029250574|nr:autophagy protein 13 [Lodderomyces elongisporus]WLF76313.1 autophagy protein 13 [Lodderomyces elongisporus]